MVANEDTVDAFVLVSGGALEDTRGFVNEAGEDGYLATGDFDGFTAFHDVPIAQVGETVRRHKTGRGPLRTDTLVGIVRIGQGVKRTGHRQDVLTAITLIDLEVGEMEAAKAALQDLEASGGIVGFGLVTGSADVIVELQGITKDEIVERITGLQKVPGIRRQRTTFIEGAA
jgi:translation initiation factor 1 (eIF-1/SUI1)